mgnify:CR=1 FL=1
MSSLLSKEEQKKRLAEKKDAQAREARLAREKEKREKKERQKEEQRKKSMSNDKTKKLTGIEAIRAAEREAEERHIGGRGVFRTQQTRRSTSGFRSCFLLHGTVAQKLPFKATSQFWHGTVTQKLPCEAIS